MKWILLRMHKNFYRGFMADLFLFLNGVLMILMWNWATDAFNNDMKFMGWIYLFFSAWNGASIAAALF